ncbi:MAG: putative DNA binding domain-containing protein [Prevotellaceae bacterium]|jgi:ATP-dependent DNA helicase RecG|nr:putative DNA binding domain-containing protein [Prevotellaceae bacterium]
MNFKHQLQIWLKEGESETLEFKTSFGPDTIETLAAFANAKGGVVLLGVSDDKTVKGVALAKESISQWINEIKSKTSPQLVPDMEKITAGNKTVVYIAIPEYPIKPVAYKGRYFKRKANANHQLSSGEVADLHLKTVNSSWDCYIREDVSMEEVSLDKVRVFVEKVQKRNNAMADDPLSFLFKYRLVRETCVTNACYLLFAKENNLYATIELGLFADETLIKDSARVKSDLFAEVEEVMAFIRKNIRKEIIITGEPQNTERWEYPLEAIRELVLNMIVHRDYTSSYDSIVKIFPGRIEFYNPGALPDNINVQQLIDDAYVSQPRNKLIAEMFKESGFIEKYGSGIKRVIGAFAEMKLPKPDFVAIPSGFKVVVYGKTDLKTDLKTDTVDVLILQSIEREATITVSEMAKRISKGLSATKARLTKLKQGGYIERIGSDKGGYWKIKTDI